MGNAPFLSRVPQAPHTLTGGVILEKVLSLQARYLPPTDKLVHMPLFGSRIRVTTTQVKPVSSSVPHDHNTNGSELVT